MPVTRNETDKVFNAQGLVSSTPVVRDVTADTIYGQAVAGIAGNRAALQLPNPTAANDTYLAIASPNNAQVIAQVRALTNQNNALIAQVRDLTRQNIKLIQLALHIFDEAD